MAAKSHVTCNLQIFYSAMLSCQGLPRLPGRGCVPLSAPGVPWARQNPIGWFSCLLWGKCVWLLRTIFSPFCARWTRRYRNRRAVNSAVRRARGRRGNRAATFSSGERRRTACLLPATGLRGRQEGFAIATNLTIHFASQL